MTYTEQELRGALIKDGEVFPCHDNHLYDIVVHYDRLKVLSDAAKDRLEMMWRPISELDLEKNHFVLLYEDGAIRLGFWNDDKKLWESPTAPWPPLDECANPTHFMPLPKPPEAV